MRLQRLPPYVGGFIGLLKQTMENFAGSLLHDYKARTRMKQSPRMKLFSPKRRTWIGQWNVRTLYESGEPSGVQKKRPPKAILEVECAR